ncbi:MAG: type IV toxin-antitoxin system AbiEi family antitoxin domain-containing protein [Pseudonocardiaceae bacterium]
MELDWYLRRQSGVISCTQARAAGLSQDVVDRRITSGRWERLHPGVYLAGDHAYTDEVRMRAAVLWAGKDAVAHGLSAAWWHDLGPALPATVEVTVRRRRGPGKQPGVSVRRRDLPYPDLIAVRDLWVTDLPLTVLEAAVALGPQGSELLDRSLQRRVKFPAVYRAHCRNQGRRGSAKASRLLAVAADRAASHAERLLIRLLRAAGITGWVLGYPVQGYLIDLAFPVQRVAVEVDGWAWHVAADRFVDDRRRQNALVNLRWTVLRFTWHDLVARPAALSRRSAWRWKPRIDHRFGRINRAQCGLFCRTSDHWLPERAAFRARGGSGPARG